MHRENCSSQRVTRVTSQMLFLHCFPSALEIVQTVQSSITHAGLFWSMTRCISSLRHLESVQTPEAQTNWFDVTGLLHYCAALHPVISLCLCLQAILNLDNTVVDLETLQALYENVSDTSFALCLIFSQSRIHFTVEEMSLLQHRCARFFSESTTGWAWQDRQAHQGFEGQGERQSSGQTGTVSLYYSSWRCTTYIYIWLMWRATSLQHSSEITVLYYSLIDMRQGSRNIMITNDGTRLD